MAALAGNKSAVYVSSASPVVFTNEATTALDATHFQITDLTKKYWDPATVMVVDVSGVPVPAGTYTLHWISGTVEFYTAPGGPVTVSGAYFTKSLLSAAKDFSAELSLATQDQSVFGATWKTFQGVQRTATVSLTQFQTNKFFLDQLANIMLLVLYANTDDGNKRWECFAFMSKDSIKAQLAGLNEESVSFEAYGEIAYVTT